MKKPPNDRLSEVSVKESERIPQIYVVVNGEEFVKPGLETYYAKTPPKNSNAAQSGCSCNPYTGTVCSCNRVCSCNPLCTCQSHVQTTVSSTQNKSEQTRTTGTRQSCSCVGYTRTTTTRGVCSCVPVH